MHTADSMFFPVWCKQLWMSMRGFCQYRVLWFGDPWFLASHCVQLRGNLWYFETWPPTAAAVNCQDAQRPRQSSVDVKQVSVCRLERLDTLYSRPRLYQSAIQDADVLVTFFRKPPESPSHANKIIEPAEDDCIGMDENMIGNQL